MNASKKVVFLVAMAAMAACHKGSGSTAGTAGSGGTSLGPPGQLAVWTAGIGRKIQPTTAVGSASTVSVETCSDATASFQVVVHGKGGSLTQVEVALDADLTDGNGHTLGKANATFYRAYFVDMKGVSANFGNLPVPANSPTGDSRIPDPLIPLVDPYSGAAAGQPFDVVEETNQPIFADVHVPKGTAAGTYTGTIHVTAAGGQSADVPLSVTVWGLDLPDMNALTTHFKMSINDLYDYHAGTAACSGNSCYLDVNPTSLKIVKRYEELAHTHRIDTAQQLVNLPGQGSCDPPGDADWAAYDASMGPYMDGSYWSDGIPSGRLDTPFNPGQNFGVDAMCNQQQYVALAAAWASHLKGKGWFEKAVVYAYDEPPMSALPGIAKNSSWLQAADPGWKARVMDTIAPDPTIAAVLNPAVGIYTVTTPWFDDWGGHPDYGRKDWPALLQMGIQLWFDEGNAVLPPYATFASNTLDGLEPTILMWGSWYEQATGFLYWDIASWDQQDPWGPEITWGKTGDGVLIYPGNHDGKIAPVGSPPDVSIDGPVPSYRLKALRNGLQDWALFHLADTLGLGAQARQAVSQVYAQLGGCSGGCPAPPGGFYWKTDEEAMATIRRTIAQAILTAQGS
jgi:hypothetical protein